MMQEVNGEREEDRKRNSYLYKYFGDLVDKRVNRNRK